MWRFVGTGSKAAKPMTSTRCEDFSSERPGVLDEDGVAISKATCERYHPSSSSIGLATPKAGTPMSTPAFDHPDLHRAELRLAVTAVDAALADTGPDATSHRATAWAKLVALLALGPAPQVKPCPKCGRVGMSDATLCGHCWARLTPAAY